MTKIHALQLEVGFFQLEVPICVGLPLGDEPVTHASLSDCYCDYYIRSTARGILIRHFQSSMDLETRPGVLPSRECQCYNRRRG